MFEDAVIADDSATEKQDPEKIMSEEMRLSVKYSIMSGIVLSVATYLTSTNANSDDIRAKMKTLVNAFKSGGDVENSDAEWLTTEYLDSVKRANIPDGGYCRYGDSAYFSWYSAINAMLNDDSVRGRWLDENNSKFTQKEREIIGRYNKARSEFYQAENEFTQYMASVNKLTINQILLKYATQFQQVVPEWYKRVLRCAGYTTPPEEG